MKSLTLLLCVLVFAATVGEAHAFWAAVVGDTGDVIYAQTYPSRDSAEFSAMHRCQSLGLANCKVVGSGVSNCFGAASNGAAAPRWGFGIDSRRLTAAGKALAACQALKAGQCHVAFLSYCR